MQLMARPKKTKADGPAEKKHKPTHIPAQYHAILKRLADESDERSVAYFVRIAVREWLERNNHLPPKAK